MKRSVSHSTPKIIFGFLVLFVAVAGGVFAVIHVSKDPVLPTSITKQATFPVYYPTGEWLVDSNSPAYKKSILSYVAQKAYVTISVNQQATPAVFNEIPQYYPTLVGKLNQYSSFNALKSTVYLTKPSELNGTQSAVFNTGSTLLFARPNKQLSDSQWQAFFASFRSYNAN